MNLNAKSTTMPIDSNLSKDRAMAATQARDRKKNPTKSPHTSKHDQMEEIQISAIRSPVSTRQGALTGAQKAILKEHQIRYLYKDVF